MATIVKEPFQATFIHIPKTGGNSITVWLKKHTKTAVTKKKQHATLDDVLNGNHILGPQKKENLGFIFCVVRNPWDYAVSWYTFKKMLCEQRLKIRLDNPNMQFKKPKDQKLSLDELMLQKEKFDLGFENWLFENYHRKPQHHWAKDCDRILKLENINEDFKIIQQYANCYEPLGVLNKTKNRKSYKDYYTSQESIDFVTKNYKIDIETYGYDF